MNAVEPPVHFRFRLYVAGHTPNSTRAAANLREMCSMHLEGRHEIEIIDVFRHPEQALVDNVLMTPTLLRLSPLPVVRVVGSLSQLEPVMQALAVPATP